MFWLDANTIFLSEVSANQVIFSRFKISDDGSAKYEVHGEPAATSSVTKLPFGSYSGPSHLQSSHVSLSSPRSHGATRPFPASLKKKHTFRKTIILVSLSCASLENKVSTSKSDITYTIVTQLVITLDMDNCGRSVVADLVKEETGYEVILLDSKCYPVLSNDTTNSVEYWKSTRKILAASETLYQKLKGTSTDLSKADIDQIIDLTEQSGPPPKVRKIASSVLEATKFDQVCEQLKSVNSRLERLENRLSFASTMIDVLICKGIIRKPLYSTCCKRMVVCDTCVRKWVTIKFTCPLCAGVVIIF